MNHYEWRRDQYRITTDPAEIDLDVVHGFLATTYWAAGVSRERLARSIEGSIPFGLFEGDRQVGFARVVTDGAVFAWLADVFVAPEARGQGLGAWLIDTILAHPDIQGLRRWLLGTRDAHGLYRRAGFTALAYPDRMMEYRPGGVDAEGAGPGPASSGQDEAAVGERGPDPAG